ncbi:hypothetical protein [Massilia sp. Mn16-1_5]|uniref:hypothetical protein n=1 Tax=Massilia sp. Mn16-1_5 TaxID=2079199 RepID=UPI00109EBD7F|nr:hypothetical protein [Massilia sp. Mn16-1_5]THC43909.1 hypothetical protein C2862_11465 [Massilia sp. Mn16-1_5]
MNEWIIAPLLEPDPTGMIAHRVSAHSADGQDEAEEENGERRHGDRRDNRDDEADPDFGRGEDRREDVL